MLSVWLLAHAYGDSMVNERFGYMVSAIVMTFKFILIVHTATLITVIL